MTGSFLPQPRITPEVQALYDEDLAETGYVWNASRLWAYQPETVRGLFDLMSQAFKPSRLSFRQRGILVTATASTLGDSYCSLAWGGKLAAASEPDLAAGVLKGRDGELSEQEKAMADWARKVARGYQRDYSGRRPGVARRRARQRPDIRNNRLRGSPLGVLDDQRLPRRSTRPGTCREPSRAGCRRCHLRAAGVTRSCTGLTAPLRI